MILRDRHGDGDGTPGVSEVKEQSEGEEDVEVS